MEDLVPWLFGTGIALLIWFRLMRISYVHPLMITLIPQIFLLAFTCTNLNHKLSPFSALTWILLIGSMACFTLGALMAFFATRKWKPLPKQITYAPSPWIVLLLPFILFGIGFFWGVARLGGNIPLFSSNPENARMLFVQGNIQNILFSAIIPTMTVVLLGLRKEFATKFRVACGVVAILAMAMYFSTGSRGLVLMFIVIAATYFDLIIGAIRIRYILASLLFLVIVFIGVGYLRYGRFVQDANKVSTRTVEKFALENTYSYSGNGFWNLDYALAKDDEGKLHTPTYGASSTEGFLRLVLAYSSLESTYGWAGALNHDVMKFHGLNSTTFHWVLIKDFGIGAPFLWSFLWGLGLTAIDRACRLTKSSGLAMFQGHLAYYTFIGFNIFPFVLTLFWVGTGMQILLVVILNSKVAKQRTA